MQSKLPQFYRQKIILSLIKKFNKRISHKEFQKLLFLFNIEKKDKSDYYFVPLESGPFSFMAQADLNRLETLELININKKMELLIKSNISSFIKQTDIKLLNDLSDKFSGIDFRNLDKYISSKYPLYSGRINTRKKKTFEKKNKGFYSIGYEGRTIDQYLFSLIKNGIKVLIDVRKNPVSMKYGFSKKTLSSACSELKIKYIHIPGLGILSESRKNLNTIADYQRLFDRYERNILSHADNHINRIYQQYINNLKVAVTCFENNIEMCHRSRILKKLKDNYSVPVEIL